MSLQEAPACKLTTKQLHTAYEGYCTLIYQLQQRFPDTKIDKCTASEPGEDGDVPCDLLCLSYRRFDPDEHSVPKKISLCPKHQFVENKISVQKSRPRKQNEQNQDESMRKSEHSKLQTISEDKYEPMIWESNSLFINSKYQKPGACLVIHNGYLSDDDACGKLINMLLLEKFFGEQSMLAATQILKSNRHLCTSTKTLEGEISRLYEIAREEFKQSASICGVSQNSINLVLKEKQNHWLISRVIKNLLQN